VAALDARLGLHLPRYSFRTGVVVHASRELAMFQQAATLVLGNDTTGATELILPVMAAGAPMASVHLLLDTLLQWVVQAPQRFGTNLVCALPGQCDGSEQPIFWQALGRHFYAGALPVDNPLFRSPLRSHMGRLMPKHPIYSSLLTAEGQSSLGHCAASALPLQQWLMAVGFRYRQQIDIVDGGPILERDLVWAPGCVKNTVGGVAAYRVATSACTRRHQTAVRRFTRRGAGRPYWPGPRPDPGRRHGRHACRRHDW